MSNISYARHHLPPTIIQYAVWLYLRSNLSLRDVEDLLAERGIDVRHETVRRWVARFGMACAGASRRRRPPVDDRRHLDEMFVSVGGRPTYLWRAVDAEGEVLDILVQRRRDKRAANKRIGNYSGSWARRRDRSRPTRSFHSRIVSTKPGELHNV